MKRIQFFEFEDLPWFPSILRRCMVEYLSWLVTFSKVFDHIVPLLKKGLTGTGSHTILDLGSGATGAWGSLIVALRKEVPGVQVTLSDLYPNTEAFRRLSARYPEHIRYLDFPVDAAHAGDHGEGMRTLFLSMHHMKPETAKQILSDAVKEKKAIAIFEGVERNAAGIVQMLFSFFIVLLFTPFVRPFRWERLLFTYLIPVLPVLIPFDGVVSALRTYTEAEMLAMAREVTGESYAWETGVKRIGPAVVVYMLGVPRT